MHNKVNSCATFMRYAPNCSLNPSAVRCTKDVELRASRTMQFVGPDPTFASLLLRMTPGFDRTGQLCSGRWNHGLELRVWPAQQTLAHPLSTLFVMALTHATSGQLLDVRPLGGRLATAKTSALFKSSDLEVMRLVLVAGKSLPPHKVPGEISIHCLEGSLNIELDDKTVRLEAGELVFLAGGATHGVKALADASALVTIALRP